MKHIKGASQAPTQLVLRNLGIQSQEIHKRKDSRLFNKKKKIKRKKSSGNKSRKKGKKRNKKRRK